MMDHFDNSFIAALRGFETDMQQAMYYAFYRYFYFGFYWYIYLVLLYMCA